MSYDITFKVKIEGVNEYLPIGDCYANTTWNVREMIVKSTGLPWYNCANNGYCKDVIPYIEKGLNELRMHPKKYKQYESQNGWGTVESTIRFFSQILESWRKFKRDANQGLVSVATFWIE